MVAEDNQSPIFTRILFQKTKLKSSSITQRQRQKMMQKQPNHKRKDFKTN